jgi:hypothetical protein
VLHPELGFCGFKNPESTVCFPLSPTRILMFDNRHSELANQYYPLRSSVADINLMMWRESIEHLFSPRHPDEICLELYNEAGTQGYIWEQGLGWFKPEESLRT